jgi:hypothetical protein
MLNYRQIEQEVLVAGKIEGPELELLHRHMYGEGGINRQKADFLVELHKRVQHLTPAFEHFFYQAIKDHVLADGRIDADEAAWLRHMLSAGRWIKDEERKLLTEIKGETKQHSPEFEALFTERMKQPQDQHTCG